MKRLVTIKFATWAFFCIAFLVFLFSPATQAQTVLHIIDDATGGDCTAIGTWNPSTKTCSLSDNIFQPIQIQIMSDGITLDGNNFTLSGDNDGYAVYVEGRRNVVIRNLVIDAFSFGITLMNSHSSLIEHNLVKNAVHGIWLDDDSSGNIITNNILENNYIGLRMCWSSNNNLVKNNIIRYNDTGILVGFSYQNVIINNAFIDNQTQAEARENINNTFINNYWSDYDKEWEGCFDSDENSFCDAPYFFTGGMDLQCGMTADVDTIPPIVEIFASPTTLWPPDERMVEVIITGSADDCKSDIASVLVTVEDEYGVYNMTVPSLNESVFLKALRNGSDKDGRVYTITAVATDAKGNEGSAVTKVVVPHSNGKVK